MFNFIKNKIKNVYHSFTNKASSLFTQPTIDEALLAKLEVLLIEADAGTTTTKKIMAALREQMAEHKIQSGADIQQALEKLLTAQLEETITLNRAPKIVLMVGINGSGKTSFCGKFANLLKKEGKKVLLVAGDTFRAAATEQLQMLGESINVPVLAGKENQDPASLIYDACDAFNHGNYDHMIIDTAGRLQTKTNLMRELEKIRKIIAKKNGDVSLGTFLSIDAMLGQNSFEQAKVFNEATHVNGIVLTKVDGSGKGGIIFAIKQELNVPIAYMTYGEKIEDIAVFDGARYVRELFEK